MNTTSESLLLRLRNSGDDSIDESAWQEFVKIYTPLLFDWARKIGLPDSDASDLVQEVLLLAFQKLPQFSYDRNSSFRGWLRTVTINKYREKRRRLSAQQAIASHSILEQLQPVDIAESTWDINYARMLVAQTMQPMRGDFAESKLGRRWSWWWASKYQSMMQRKRQESARGRFMRPSRVC